MTGGIGKDPEAGLPFALGTDCAQGEEIPLSLIRVAYPDVEVQLLRIRRVGPARRHPFGCPLEGQLTQAGPVPMTTQSPRCSLTCMPSTWQ